MKLDNVFRGDCFKYLKTLPPNSVDLIVSSPPYNIGKEYETKVNLDEYLTTQASILKECYRVLKDSGSIFWQIGSFSSDGILIPLDVKFFPIFEQLEMYPRNRIVWLRPHGLHATSKFSGRHETILWFTKSKKYKFLLDNIRVPQKYQNKKHYNGSNKGNYSCHPDGKNPGDVWAFRNVKHNHEEQTIHPCQFPEDLIERVIYATTEENDVVLDPYMGTGTVAVVAKRHNRRYLGAEIDKVYHEVGQRRIEGQPDKNGVFPNLKTLREYIDKTGENISAYRFEVQIGKTATSKSASKIFPEEHHLEDFEKRIEFEENSFIAKINGKEAPQSPFKVGHKKEPTGHSKLF
jgi:adenine-specific DNA-methyltransferase